VRSRISIWTIRTPYVREGGGRGGVGSKDGKSGRGTYLGYRNIAQGEREIGAAVTDRGRRTPQWTDDEELAPGRV